jgi:hypothetical protein
LKITDRDRRICSDVYEHRVLTTHQLSDLHFDSPRRARRRLHILSQEKVLLRFQPHRRTGSHPRHYVLGPKGAAIVAAERGVDPKQLDVRTARLLGLEHSPRLKHLLGINSLFSRLANRCRQITDAALEIWWGEVRCAATWAPIVRPDGFGVLRLGRRRLSFFLEFDRGSEELDVVATKCAEYARAARLSNAADVLLFVVLTSRREAEVRRMLGGCGVSTFTTTVDRLADDPLSGKAWLAIGGDVRKSLEDITRHVAGEQ